MKLNEKHIRTTHKIFVYEFSDFFLCSMHDTQTCTTMFWQFTMENLDHNPLSRKHNNLKFLTNTLKR